MSQTSRFLVHLTRNISQVIDDEILRGSIDGNEGSSSFEPAITNEETVSLQDLLNSPDFVEEQRLILLEFETAQLRIEDDQRKTPPRRQELQRRSRRSSIGIKLTCPICLENLTSIRFSDDKMVTECGHVFCQACIEGVCKAAQKKNAALCPVCRDEVGELRKVYF